jgi:RNA polymerase sigma-70 factor (ECF subfamily)
MRERDLNLTWRRLFALAYRMTGRVADAQDLVQEAFARYEARQNATDIAAPEAYLARIVTRLALNAERARRRSPIDYVGFDLPEPIPDEGSSAKTEELAYGLAVALQLLGPVERAVYLLRSMYEADYAEIGAIVGRRQAACRKIFSRAQEKVQQTERPEPLDSRADQQLLQRLVDAVRSGDLAGVTALLAEGVVLMTNGRAGGPALARPLVGREAVARFAIASIELLPDGFKMKTLAANGAPVMLATHCGAPVFALLVEGTSQSLRRLYGIGDPRKLVGFKERLS